MKFRQLLFIFLGFAGFVLKSAGQTTTCPAPNPDDPDCYQTSRTTPEVPTTNPLWNWPPLPNQDCCNAIPLCQPLNEIVDSSLIPPPPVGSTSWPSPFFPGCVKGELPPQGTGNCFFVNEKGTTWYKFQIRPLPNGPTAPGSPAGKLRFKIIPKDALADPNYDPTTDEGDVSYGNTDYDFLLFDVTSVAGNDGAVCTKIRNSPGYGTANSVIASCNWTGTRGPTGLFEPGTGTAASQGPAVRFNKPLSVKVGQVFYLAIDNFSVNIQGFFVDFRGLEAPDDSTAVVNPPATDTIKIKEVTNPICASQSFVLKFDKPVRCDSVRPGKFLLQGLDPNYIITSIVAQGGCNPGGQDTAFVFTISPFQPDTTLRLILASEIKDICGNKVLFDTTSLRVEYPVPLIFGISGKQPSCGITELTIQFAKKVYCDSLKASKFQILFNNSPFGQVTGIRRFSGLCGPGILDSLYIVTFSDAIVDTMNNLALALQGVVRDFCGNPVAFDTLNFKINKFLTVTALPKIVCPGVGSIIEGVRDSTFLNVSNATAMEYWWKDVDKNEKLVDDGDTIIFKNDFSSKVQVKHKDIIRRDTTLYRVYALNKLNNCLDSADVPVVFSAKPYSMPITTQTACFGETMTISPAILYNVPKEELAYVWTRENAPTDTLSKEFELVQVVDTTLLNMGVLQNYVLNMRFLDSLGGCKADPIKFSANYGREIKPKVFIDDAQKFASILPADFRFFNQSTFTPTKTGATYLWNFGDNTSKVIVGEGPADVTYSEPGRFTAMVTAFDTLYTDAVTVGKICQNFDTVSVYTQNLIPSLVTSNGDGFNDFFEIEGLRPNTFTMKLYNRWGKKVADQDPFKVEGFDPKSLEPGIYYYILTEKRSSKNLVGWVQLTKP